MQPTQDRIIKPVMAVSLELSGKSWKVAATDGRRERASMFVADAKAPSQRLEEVMQRLHKLGEQWGMPEGRQVVVIYEAGQDGFWIARALERRSIKAVVVDAASIPVARQARRAKTDRLDALLLLRTLQTWLAGQRDCMRVVHVPDEQAEMQRHLARDRGELQKEVCQHRDRIRKLLRTEGCWQEVQDDVCARLEAGEFVCAHGQALPAQLRERLLRESERLRLAQQQLATLERGLLAQLPEPLRAKIAQLAQLKGVGWVGAMRLVLELYWRNFRNRRQVGSCVGLVPQPYDSGDSRVDQGISKQGNRRVRALLIEMAWMWLRYQPDSAMAQWFAQRTAASASNKRGKRIAIVAVARRLAIALWRYLADGVVPQGAQFKKA